MRTYRRRRTRIFDAPAVRAAFARARVDLGLALLALRERRGLTREQAAKRMRMSRQQLQRIEAGTENPTLGTLVAAVVAYGARLGDLFRR